MVGGLPGRRAPWLQMREGGVVTSPQLAGAAAAIQAFAHCTEQYRVCPAGRGLSAGLPYDQERYTRTRTRTTVPYDYDEVRSTTARTRRK